MSDEYSMFQVRWTERAVIVVLECNVIMSDNDISVLDAELTDVLEDKRLVHMVIDFTKVRHLSSSALGYLITLRNIVHKRGGHLRLCCVGGKVKGSENDKYVYELFKVVKLDKFFELSNSIEEAVRSLP